MDYEDLKKKLDNEQLTSTERDFSLKTKSIKRFVGHLDFDCIYDAVEVLKKNYRTGCYDDLLLLYKYLKGLDRKFVDKLLNLTQYEKFLRYLNIIHDQQINHGEWVTIYKRHAHHRRDITFNEFLYTLIDISYVLFKSDDFNWDGLITSSHSVTIKASSEDIINQLLLLYKNYIIDSQPYQNALIYASEIETTLNDLYELDQHANELLKGKPEIILTLKQIFNHYVMMGPDSSQVPGITFKIVVTFAKEFHILPKLCPLYIIVKCFKSVALNRVDYNPKYINAKTQQYNISNTMSIQDFREFVSLFIMLSKECFSQAFLDAKYPTEVEKLDGLYKWLRSCSKLNRIQKDYQQKGFSLRGPSLKISKKFIRIQENHYTNDAKVLSSYSDDTLDDEEYVLATDNKSSQKITWKSPFTGPTASTVTTPMRMTQLVNDIELDCSRISYSDILRAKKNALEVASDSGAIDASEEVHADCHRYTHKGIDTFLQRQVQARRERERKSKIAWNGTTSK